MNNSAFENRLGFIPSDHYIRDDIFSLELKYIFELSWLCVGFTEDLKNHNDFITANIGDRSIVVQNFHGELSAFRNVCTHRFSRIQMQSCGNRPLQCPYHGWTFDSKGLPSGIPMNRQYFGFEEADKQRLALQKYDIEIVGHFIFVCMNSKGLSLVEFLGDFYEDLQHVSEICTDRFETAQFQWNANWKVGMENAAEGYHVPLVHPNTFGTNLSLDLEISKDCEHSRYTGKLKDKSLKWWSNVEKAIELKPSQRYPGNGNFLIFPNIVVTFIYGSVLTFQTFEPISTNNLRINTTSWLAKNNGNAARSMVLEYLKTFSETARNEDRDICTQVQAGMRDLPNNRPVMLGELEGRIAHFQRSYMARMGSASI
jgi:choline monooxygenase